MLTATSQLMKKLPAMAIHLHFRAAESAGWPLDSNKQISQSVGADLEAQSLAAGSEGNLSEMRDESAPSSLELELEGPQGQAYNESAFRHFLAIERNRSERSARPF